ncbi:MAG: SDR family NAD(P)-dependent oxidoreductase [Oscillospiraceae bacterium]|nr:SDR family NAD(P)-dependent oxidoreductase [Oscillospiraceae bacterium]
MGRRVLVTGAGRGLGFALTALHLAAGDEVYAYEYALSDELEALKMSHAGRLHIYKCDIGSTQSVENAMSALVEKGGQLDIIYNVAGLYIQGEREKGLAQTDLDDGMDMYNVNGVGLLRVCKAAFPLIGKGTLVVNITSEAGSITACDRAFEYMYCISKAAANMASKLLSNELHPLGARVICINPGWMQTQIGGERAADSPGSIPPEKSAKDILGIVGRIDKIPHSHMFMWHHGTLLPW